MKLNPQVIELKKLRKAAGLTQAELAVMAKIPASTLGNYEASRHRASPKVFNRLLHLCRKQIVRNQRLVEN